jgi:hypothetical protein
LASLRGELRWVEAGRSELTAGKMLLREPGGSVLVILGFQCYVRPLGEHRFVVWYDDHSQDAFGVGWIRLAIFDADQLRPIAEPDAAVKEMALRGARIFHKAGEVACASVLAHEEPGQHPLELPKPFDEIDEILILAHTGWTSGADQTSVALFILRPRDHMLEIYPQDWFNHGKYDFGYQWITRVVRDPANGRIVGDGIRIGAFELDRSNRQLKRWLSL